MPPYQVVHQNGHQFHVLDIDPKMYKMKAVISSQAGGRQTVSSFVKDQEAVAGINGGFFHLQNGEGKPAGVLKIHDKWLGFSSKPRGAIGWNENDPNILIDRILTKREANAVRVYPQIDNASGIQQAWEEMEYIVGGIPLLIKNGKPINKYTSEITYLPFINQRHARTAVCLKNNAHWLWVVVSHTKEANRPFVQEIFEGLTLYELTQFLLEQGCVQAVNLDGGGSSTLVINDKIMNSQAGDLDGILHLYHERPVTDAILIFHR